MKKVILATVVFISLILIILRFLPLAINKYLAIEGKAGIKILSQPQQSQVFLNKDEVGKTPYENQELSAGEYTIKLQNKGLNWEGRVKLNSGTITIINRDLSQDSVSSAGESLTLEKGKGITVVSKPDEAEVEIDGKFYGKTPLAQKEVSSAEHTINISHGNFIKRSIRAYIPENYKLVINVDLAISEPDLTAVNSTPIMTTPEVKVLNTPTGFLRVRDKPSLNGVEIGRVLPGDKLILLEELSGWDRVRMADNKEGYVSASYVEKQSTQIPK